MESIHFIKPQTHNEEPKCLVCQETLEDRVSMCKFNHFTCIACYNVLISNNDKSCVVCRRKCDVYKNLNPFKIQTHITLIPKFVTSNQISII